MRYVTVFEMWFDTNFLNDYWMGSMRYSQIAGNMVKSESIWVHSHSKSNGNAIWIDEKNNTIFVWKQKRKECELWKNELSRILRFYCNVRFHFKSDNNISCLHLPVNILLLHSFFVSWKDTSFIAWRTVFLTFHFDCVHTYTCDMCLWVLLCLFASLIGLCLCVYSVSCSPNCNPSYNGNDALQLQISFKEKE